MALRRPPRLARGALLGLLVAMAWATCEPEPPRGVTLRGTGAGEGAGIAGRRDVPDDLDTRTTRRSARGLWRGTLEPVAGAAPLHELHAWRLRLEQADGAPLEGAWIRIAGGMPQHDHGLPTQPQVAGTRDEYLVDGVRFHMAGWWQLVFDIEAAGERDVLTFDLLVE